MKNIFLIIAVSFFISVRGQVFFEHDYDSASVYSSGSPAVADQLELVKFEVSGEKYVKICRHQKTIRIYDLNHSFLNSIDYSSFPQATTANNSAIFLYFSESLFDSDPGAEFVYLANTGTPYTGIYNDDGSLIFSDTGASLIFVSYPSQQMPIYNTSQGTKMILSYKNGHAKVFGLPGTLTTAIQIANQNLMGAQGLVSNPAPNPTSGTPKIEYTLPKNSDHGEIVFYDQQGTEIKRFKVDRTFDHLLVSTADIPAGTYFYQLQTGGKASEGKKLVVIK